MTLNCPSCKSSHTAILESRICSTNGSRRRRIACQTCDHRWTIWTGERPDRLAVNRQPRKRRRTALTDAQIRQILQSTELSNRQMGLLVKRHAETIREIRIGRLAANIHPEIARWPLRQQVAPQPPAGGPSCHACEQWTADGRCRMGFPDPLEEGPAFASDCSLYEPIIQSMSRA